MRDSNYTVPAQNRVSLGITQQLYDRRALDTSASLPLLNSLTHLTHFTSTTARIRDALTTDGGLERLLEILKETSLPRPSFDPSGDWWSMKGPCTASAITPSQIMSLKHSLAFHCVVNIGVRGSEQVRTRLVQAGTLDVIAQILEVWLKGKGMSIPSGALGSQASVDRSEFIAASALAAIRGEGSGSMYEDGFERYPRHGHGHGKEKDDGDKGVRMENLKRWTREQRARMESNPGGSSSSSSRTGMNGGGNGLAPSQQAGPSSSSTQHPRDRRRDRNDPAYISSTFHLSAEEKIARGDFTPEIMAQVRQGILNGDTLVHYIMPEDICTDIDFTREEERNAITAMHALARIAGISKVHLWRYANENSEDASMVRQYFRRFRLEIRSLTGIHLDGIERRNAKELVRLERRSGGGSGNGNGNGSGTMAMAWIALMNQWTPMDVDFWQPLDLRSAFGGRSGNDNGNGNAVASGSGSGTTASNPPSNHTNTREESMEQDKSSRRRERERDRSMTVDIESVDVVSKRMTTTPAELRIQVQPYSNASLDISRTTNPIDSHSGRVQVPDVPMDQGGGGGGGGGGEQNRPVTATAAMDIPAYKPSSSSGNRNHAHSQSHPQRSRSNLDPNNIQGENNDFVVTSSLGGGVVVDRGDSPMPGSVSSSNSGLSQIASDTSLGGGHGEESASHSRDNSRDPSVSTRDPGAYLAFPHLTDTAASSNGSTPVGTPTGDIGRPRSGTVTRAHAPPDALGERRDTIHLEEPSRSVSRASRAGTEDEDSTDVEVAVIGSNGVEQEVEIVGIADDEEEQIPPGLTALVNHDMNDMQQAQTEVDMAMGAPPGAPGAIQTPRITEMTPRQNMRQPPLAPPNEEAPGEAGPARPDHPTVTAAGAPRSFSDLNDLFNFVESTTITGEITYSDDTILLCLQLLAYLSKYPHVRNNFHCFHAPTHPELDIPEEYELPQRPALAESTNLFSLVERLSFRPSPPDPDMQRLPEDVQEWSGVIMRNVYRKVESFGGIRQCANLACGKWERYPRQFAKCRRCRRAKYCSKECQSRAWQEGHRFWCSPRETAPGDASLRGTLFALSGQPQPQRIPQAVIDPRAGSLTAGVRDVRMRTGETPGFMDIPVHHTQQTQSRARERQQEQPDAMEIDPREESVPPIVPPAPIVAHARLFPQTRATRP